MAGLRPRSTSCRPRIHDLRHSFAVRSMLDAYAAGQDGHTRLTLLSTWLGHVHPASTYWYLPASPELMTAAYKRLEAHLPGSGLAPEWRTAPLDQAKPSGREVFRANRRTVSSLARREPSAWQLRPDITDSSDSSDCTRIYRELRRSLIR